MVAILRQWCLVRAGREDQDTAHRRTYLVGELYCHPRVVDGTIYKTDCLTEALPDRRVGCGRLVVELGAVKKTYRRHLSRKKIKYDASQPIPLEPADQVEMAWTHAEFLEDRDR